MFNSHNIQSHKTIAVNLQNTNSDTIYRHCKFTGIINLLNCELHDCDLTDCKINILFRCKLFSTKLDRVDFSTANVFGSITNAGAPCSAIGCEWQGITATMDCGFFQGLKTDDGALLFLIMALIPDYPSKDALYKSLPAELRAQAQKRLKRQFRGARS